MERSWLVTWKIFQIFQIQTLDNFWGAMGSLVYRASQFFGFLSWEGGQILKPVFYHPETWYGKYTMVLKKWCFWTVLLKTLEIPLDCKEIKPVHPKGNQSWILIGRTDAEAETPILWPPDAKNWLIGKDPDARQEQKGMTEDEMIEWHHWLNGHEFK